MSENKKSNPIFNHNQINFVYGSAPREKNKRSPSESNNISKINILSLGLSICCKTKDGHPDYRSDNNLWIENNTGTVVWNISDVTAHLDASCVMYNIREPEKTLIFTTFSGLQYKIDLNTLTVIQKKQVE